VVAECELGIDAVLDAVQAQLRQARRLEEGERLTELGERLAAPQRERLAEEARGRPRIPARQRRASRVAQPLEAGEIDGLGIDDERVAARPRRQHAGGQRLAQLRDVDLHHLRSGAGRILAPEVVDEAFDRHGAIRVEGQPSEQRAGLAAAEADRCGPVAHLERAEEERHHGDGGRCYARARTVTGWPAAHGRGGLPSAEFADTHGSGYTRARPRRVDVLELRCT
jgi:hypothetical protein